MLENCVTNKAKTIMKKALLSVLLLVVTVAAVAQPSTLQLKGTLVDGEQNAILYATVLLTPHGEEFRPDGENHHFTTSDKEGHFCLQAVAGDYTLTLSSIGYENLKKDIQLTADTNLGEIILKESVEAIADVVITGGLIRREADRFVMNNLSESVLSKGRTTYEMLKLAPAVYATEDGAISINGKSGVKVLINEREMRMTGDQLMNYLKAIPAENLQKIEIIPVSGADHDANSASGVIKIALRKQRDSGTSGSFTMAGNASTTSNGLSIGPNGSINHKSGKWNLYTQFSLSSSTIDTTLRPENALREEMDYSNGAKLTSTSNTKTNALQGGVDLGVIYDFTERSSLGVEYNFWASPDMINTTISELNYRLGDYEEFHSSVYDQLRSTTNQSASANYIQILDERGSTFKILADWANNRTNGSNLNTDNLCTVMGGEESSPTDSLYRNSSMADYSYYTLSAAVEKKLSDVTTLSYGAKYSLTDNYSTTSYDYKRGDEWVALNSYNSTTDYNEHIAALYGIYSTRFASGFAFSAGLRAEYTSIPELKESYLSLFPNLSASMPLNPLQTVILSGSYKRGISRPSFWQMNPIRQQLSEYSYQIGNPNLKPVYSNEISLSAILFYRYSVTLGAYLQDGIISQLSMVDEADPTGRTLKYFHENMHNLYQYYIQVNIPAQVTPWWNLNGNILGVMLDQRIAESDANDRTFTWQGYLNNTFTLPHNHTLSVWGNFTTAAKIGNLTQEGKGNISMSVTKNLLDNNLAVIVGINNILNTSHQKIHSSGEGFTRYLYGPSNWTRSINVAIRYNFHSGKMFRVREVESGAEEEKSRIK